MAKCKGKTTDGTPCGMNPLRGQPYCFAHSPEAAPARAAARKLGGFNRHTPHAGDPSKIPANIETAADDLKVLQYIQDELIVMENSIPRNRALIALVATRNGIRETSEIQTELKELRAALQAREVKQ